MADDTRLRILRAGGPIFAGGGFEGTTVREICAAADVNLASVNYHFGSKETLYLETVQLAHQEKLLRVPPAAWPADASPQDKLRVFVGTILNRLLGEGDIGWETRLLMREMIHPTHACRPLVEDYIRPQFDQLLDVLAELLPDTTEPSVRHRVAFSIVGQCLHYRFASEFVSLLIGDERSTGAYSIEELSEHITRFSLGGLEAFRNEQPRSTCLTERPEKRNESGTVSATSIH